MQLSAFHTSMLNSIVFIECNNVLSCTNEAWDNTCLVS